MRRGIRIGDRLYSSKSKATQACRSVLYAYQPGQTVDEPEHDQFLRELLELHPESEQKIGSGVHSFQVERNQGSVGFWLTRVDGSRTDWSFVACLSPPTHEKEVLAALRTEVRSQIESFRDQAFFGAREISCSVTCERVTRQNSHVDHDPPFAELVADWMREQIISFDAIEVLPTSDGATATWLKDAGIRASWFDFHKRHAGLRIVSAKANLGVLRRRQ